MSRVDAYVQDRGENDVFERFDVVRNFTHISSTKSIFILTYMHKCSSPLYIVFHILLYILTQAIMHTYLTHEPQTRLNFFRTKMTRRTVDTRTVRFEEVKSITIVSLLCFCI